MLSCYSSEKRNKDEVRVFYAASLTQLIDELRDSFELHNKAEVKLNIASSGTLARQIKQGNRVDVYISANKHWADFVDDLEFTSLRQSLYKNRLVIIAPELSKLDSIDFTQPIYDLFNGYLSIGDPSHVPAGMYASQALTSLGWYEDLKKRILPAKDVRSALMVVALGECELGIVYYSDAIQSTKVKILGILPDTLYELPILYALLSKNANEASAEFYKMLSDSSMQQIWIRYGFIPIDTITKP